MKRNKGNKNLIFKLLPNLEIPTISICICAYKWTSVCILGGCMLFVLLLIYIKMAQIQLSYIGVN